MEIPLNRFKQRLQRGEIQLGSWVALAHPVAAELSATAGFDWLLLDGEHGPNTLASLLAQLQAIAAYPCPAVIRPPSGDRVFIQQLLDLGAQTLLIPMVHTPAQAAELVQATRYPPQGQRGIGSSIARASRWGRVTNYLDEADAQQCLLVQIESAEGLRHLEAIAAVDGVDGVFIGPDDLAGALGHRGNAAHPQVEAAIEKAIDTAVRCGTPVGLWCDDPARAQHYVERGARVIGISADTDVLMSGLLRAREGFAGVTAPVSGCR